ncbi:MAG TPA: methyltransferase [Chitinophagaceae bacterium]|nr:methyltransferase [Chitinophagaceae bacterium]
MPNPYFQFKQFTIYHDQCAMKVCTDACILGAWFAEKVPAYAQVLDIGSGSGLLMMMLAQKNRAGVHGIEIDLPSFKQLKENISHSKWKDKLKAFPGDVRTFSFPGQYDFIISNPPFYENDLMADADNLNVAKHSRLLTLDELVQVIDRDLTRDGSFGVLLPFHRVAYFEELSRKAGFWLWEKLLVRQSPKHEYFRGILHFGRKPDKFMLEHELVIQDERGEYTPEFRELLKDYYLYL